MTTTTIQHTINTKKAPRRELSFHCTGCLKAVSYTHLRAHET
jgi:hypothetical protein